MYCKNLLLVLLLMTGSIGKAQSQVAKEQQYCRAGEKKLGLSIQPKDGSFKKFVTALSTGAPAIVAGLQLNDEVISVNGIELLDMQADAIFPFLASMPDQGIVFEIRRNELVKKITVNKKCPHLFLFTCLSGDCINGQGTAQYTSGLTATGLFVDGTIQEGAFYANDNGTKVLVSRGTYNRNGHLISGPRRVATNDKVYYRMGAILKDGNPYNGIDTMRVDSPEGKLYMSIPYQNGVMHGIGYSFNSSVSNDPQKMNWVNGTFVPDKKYEQKQVYSNPSNAGSFEGEYDEAPVISKKGKCSTCNGSGYVTTTNSFGGNVDMGTAYDPKTGTTSRTVSKGTERVYSSKVSCSKCNGKGVY